MRRLLDAAVARKMPDGRPPQVQRAERQVGVVCWQLVDDRGSVFEGHVDDTPLMAVQRLLASFEG